MADYGSGAQPPRGLASYDRVFAANSRGWLGVHPNKVREALGQVIDDDELVDSHHPASRLYLGNEDTTIQHVVLLLTDRKLIVLHQVKPLFRTQVSAFSFEYAKLLPKVECEDVLLTPGSTVVIPTAFLRFLDGKVHNLNFSQSSRRDSFAEAFERLASAWATRGMLFDPRGPERAYEEAIDAVTGGVGQDWAKSFEWCVKAVDRLHDHYVPGGFRARHPSDADEEIVIAVVRSLRETRRYQPQVDVTAGVKEATHRLRSISTFIDRSNGDSSLYRKGLEGLAKAAPDVDVSDVLWEP